MVDQQPFLRPVWQAVIIDDDPAFAKILTQMLYTLGLETTVSTDASSSFTFDVSEDDIVFLDALMPNTSGFKYWNNSPSRMPSAE
jgi:DNA-binding NtrC family response regulator